LHSGSATLSCGELAQTVLWRVLWGLPMAVPRLVGIPELMVPLAEVDVECDDAASCHASNDCPLFVSHVQCQDGGITQREW
jgi:hypothetical protein